MPNPTLISGTQNNAAIASGTSATVTSTGNTTAGNLQIVCLLVGGATQPTALSPPAGGWTTFLATTATASAGTIAFAIFSKVATGGAFSGAFTWTTTATSGHWAFTEWSGAGAGLVDGSVATTQNILTVKTSPSVTPGAGNVNDTLVCCCLGGAVSVDTLTIPAGMSAISSMATAGTAAIPFFYGAFLNLASAAATGAKTWTIPTNVTNLGVSFLIQQGPVWGFSGVDYSEIAQPLQQAARSYQRGAMLRGSDNIERPFTQWVNAGWEVQPPQPPIRLRSKNYSALKHRVEFVGFNMLNWGFDPQPPQPPHPKTQKYGAYLRGPDGTDAPFIQWFNQGWEVQPPQPPHKWYRGHGLRGDDGTQRTLINWFNVGWEVQPPQPPHPRPEKSASLMRGWDGIDYPFTQWLNAGWEVQPPQPPHYRSEKSGSLMRGPDGTDYPFIQWFNFGWEFTPSTPPHPRPERSGALYGGVNIEAVLTAAAPVIPAWGHLFDPALFARRFLKSPEFGDSGTQSPLINWFNSGWEAQPPQPPHPRRERAGSLLRGIDGTEAQLIPWFNWGWEPQYQQPPHPRWLRPGSLMRGSDGTDAAFIQWLNWGWEVQAHQPQHLFRQKYAAFMRGVDGIESPFVFVPVATTWWEIQAYQPQHVFRERRNFAGGINIDPIFVFVPPPPIPEWYEDPHEMLRRPPRTMAALKHRVEFQGFNLLHWGFDAQPFQPPSFHYLNKTKGEALVGVSEFASFDMQPFNWENFPPFVRRRRIVNSFPVSDGSEIPFTFVALPTPSWWETTPPITWNLRRMRGGGFLRGDEGIQFPLIRFLPYGWDPQPWQPPRQRWEHRGNIFLGDSGIEALPIRWVNWGEEIQPWQPPHWPPLARAIRGAVLKGTDSVDFPFIPSAVVIPSWFENTPLVVPHPRQARGAAFNIGDSGTEFIYLPTPIPPIPFLPRRLTGKTFVIDATPSMIDRPMYVFGPNPRVGESCSLVFVVGPGLPSLGGAVLFTFTRPDGTIVNGDVRFAFIGSPTVTQHYIPNFLADQYLVYNFGLGELNQRGLWKVSAIAAGFFSNTYSFTVV